MAKQHNIRFMVKKSYQGERILKKYDEIIARNFSNLGDYSLAKRTLDQLAQVFDEVGDHAYANKLRAEKKRIDDALNEVSAALDI